MKRVRKKIAVECDFCHKLYEREEFRVKESIKHSWKMFCSSECRRLSKTKKQKRFCECCGKKFFAVPSEEKEKPRRFCSNSCSAKVTNKERHISLGTKRKIKESLIRKFREEGTYIEKKKCPCCKNEFKPNNNRRMCCSRECSFFIKNGSLPIKTEKELINRLQSIYVELGFCPSSKKTPKRIVYASKKFFGSWNKALIAAGIKANKQKYCKNRLKCNDGHMADSISEKIVDDWLFKNNIQHEREKKYDFNTNMTCDFYLTKSKKWMEYFGLYSQIKEYDAVVKMKQKEMGDKLISIYPDDLYPRINLDKILKKQLNVN